MVVVEEGQGEGGAVRNYESYENHFGLTFILQLKSQHLYSSQKLSSA